VWPPCICLEIFKNDLVVAVASSKGSALRWSDIFRFCAAAGQLLTIVVSGMFSIPVLATLVDLVDHGNFGMFSA